MPNHSSGLLVNEASNRKTQISFASNSGTKNGTALTNAEYRKKHCLNMKVSIGPRSHENCPFGVTFQEFHPSNPEAHEIAIAATYKQIFGNLGLTQSQRMPELDAQLLDGRITVRTMVKALAKTEVYKQVYFYQVSPWRSIELLFKHLLGRSPICREEVATKTKHLHDFGYESLVDSFVDSAEYIEVFGDSIVPHKRAFKSEAGMRTIVFKSSLEMHNREASSDSALGTRALTQPILLKRSNISLFKGSNSSISKTTRFWEVPTTSKRVYW
ncbi:MAG: hypothetical protein GKR83_02050 [Synechococcus sp. s2_metabat2_7]|nr:hypothetical protein [Synechococcus sp. s2_metabat2_7]